MTNITLNPVLISGLTDFLETNSKSSPYNLMAGLLALGKLYVEIENLNLDEKTCKEEVTSLLKEHLEDLKSRLMTDYPGLMEESFEYLGGNS